MCEISTVCGKVVIPYRHEETERQKGGGNEGEKGSFLLRRAVKAEIDSKSHQVKQYLEQEQEDGCMSLGWGVEGGWGVRENRLNKTENKSASFLHLCNQL